MTRINTNVFSWSPQKPSFNSNADLQKSTHPFCRRFADSTRQRTIPPALLPRKPLRSESPDDQVAQQHATCQPNPSHRRQAPWGQRSGTLSSHLDIQSNKGLVLPAAHETLAVTMTGHRASMLTTVVHPSEPEPSANESIVVNGLVSCSTVRQATLSAPGKASPVCKAFRLDQAKLGKTEFDVSVDITKQGPRKPTYHRRRRVCNAAGNRSLRLPTKCPTKKSHDFDWCVRRHESVRELDFASAQKLPRTMPSSAPTANAVQHHRCD